MRDVTIHYNKDLFDICRLIRFIVNLGHQPEIDSGPP